MAKGANASLLLARLLRSSMAHAMLADHILFLDGEAIIVDKPSRLPVDPPRDGSLSLELRPNGRKPAAQSVVRIAKCLHCLEYYTTA